MARIGWIFYDPVNDITEIMEVNPNSGASPDYRKNLTKKGTSAPDGPTLVFEGNPGAVQFPFSGVILTEAQYNFLFNAWDKRYPIEITDDLGRVWRIYLETFSPKRKIAHDHPWRHDYTCDGVLVQ